jgi:hypothetical protein
MRLPFNVSTTTGNMMIGVTATTGSGVFFKQGYVDPGFAMQAVGANDASDRLVGFDQHFGRAVENTNRSRA